MKTNVKNEIIFLGEVATEDDTLRIGEVGLLDIRFFIPTDFCPVFAERNEKGIVERIIIDVNPENWHLYMMDDDDIITGEIENSEGNEQEKRAELLLKAVLRNL
ncbi:hypothetical protein IIM_05353 [Bacillus cereus VD107]|nr:hypothetical protein IIM_05353 [Bacillus cereus VD107]